MTRPRNRGFTYVGVMFVVVFLGITLAIAGQVWHTNSIREREQELLFTGDQYRRAIEAYYTSNTGAGDRYPTDIDDLLRDPRFPSVRRYLRKNYVDPMTSSPQWGLIKNPAEGIIGVYSLARGQPVKRAGFTERYANFSGAKSYSEWQFVATIAEDAPGKN